MRLENIFNISNLAGMQPERSNWVRFEQRGVAGPAIDFLFILPRLIASFAAHRLLSFTSPIPISPYLTPAPPLIPSSPTVSASSVLCSPPCSADHDQHPLLLHRLFSSPLPPRHFCLRSLALFAFFLIVSQLHLTLCFFSSSARRFSSAMGVAGDRRHGHHPINFHVHIPYPHLHLHHRGVKKRDLIPKGCVLILVGRGEDSERFVVPVFYINHPLFTPLLKAAEDEYGFDRTGPIAIPCLVDHFRAVQNSIDTENSIFHHHHNLHFLDRCFRH